MYVKQIASPGLMHETEHSGMMHWGDPEGWDGERGGRGFRMWDTCTTVAYSCQCMAKPPQHCKVISLQLKNKKKEQSETEANSTQDQQMALLANTLPFRSLPNIYSLILSMSCCILA